MMNKEVERNFFEKFTADNVYRTEVLEKMSFLQQTKTGITIFS
ncbi:MAG: hypothetical protein PHP72_03570 [Dysgonamonadaceae bacterium]|jgi:hypothetical protein|nr:hypothetical protein [Dysgonamonadaceae bacterium]HTO16588.1 hypothetical protein [Edaphocola sp.]